MLPPGLHFRLLCGWGTRVRKSLREAPLHISLPTTVAVTTMCLPLVKGEARGMCSGPRSVPTRTQRRRPMTRRPPKSPGRDHKLHLLYGLQHLPPGLGSCSQDTPRQ